MGCYVGNQKNKRNKQRKQRAAYTTRCFSQYSLEKLRQREHWMPYEIPLKIFEQRTAPR